MAWQKAQPRTPTTISSVTINLTRVGTSYLATYAVQVADQNNIIMDVPGDNGELLSILAPAQINQLKAFIDSMWDKANSELLGG